MLIHRTGLRLEANNIQSCWEERGPTTINCREVRLKKAGTVVEVDLQGIFYELDLYKSLSTKDLTKLANWQAVVMYHTAL